VNRVGLTALAGGLLWVPYGIFEMVEPLGKDTAYDSGRNYELVLDRGIYTLYSLPGALAVILTATALLGVLRHLQQQWGTAVGRLAGWLAVALGVISLVGLAIPFDPLFTGPRILGTLLLGLATVLGATAARGRSRTYLAVLGVTGLALMPLWPLVYAVEVVPVGVGAALIALFGLGWAALGAKLLRTERRPDGPREPTILGRQPSG